MDPDVESGGSQSNLAADRSGINQPLATGPSAVAFVYNAFISYSHAADDALAPALRNGLQRFATPWRVFRWINPVRSVRVFQDQANLSANPALWPTIEDVLATADWFILLASPRAADSTWVGKEVEFWCRNRTPEKLLIVQTDGDIAWDAVANDFDWAQTTALPKQLANAYEHQPRWIDARWARTSAQATLRDPRFRDLVAELAAPLRGIPKDELIGEDIRQHRRLNWWRNTALTLTTLLLIFAVSVGVIALFQRSQAIAQRNAAIEQRDQAQRNQSWAVASLANAQTAAGYPATALRVALAGVPQIIAKPDRAYALEAEGAALNALSKLREQRRIGHATSMAFSPDGRMLATGSHDDTGDKVRFWVLASGKETATLQGTKFFASDVAFSPDGRLIATLGSLDRTARVWEVATGREIVALEHSDLLHSIAFSPDGRRLATASDVARSWDVATGKEMAALRGHKSRVDSAVFSPDGTKILTASGDAPTMQWDGKKVLTASDDITARLWDAVSGKELAVLRGHYDRIWSAVFSPDGTKVLTASEDHTARLWDARNGRQIAVLRGHGGIVWSAVFSPDGTKVLTASWDETARLWDAASGKELAVLRGHEDIVRSVAFNPDGRMVATGSEDDTARLWDVATGKEIATLRGHKDYVMSVVFSPDGGTLATLSRDNHARLWDATATATPTRLARAERGMFSPDGTKLVTESYKTVTVWEVATGKELLTPVGHGDSVNAAAFSPDGTKLLTASDDMTARLWDAVSGKELAVLRGHHDTIWSAVFSPDGTKVLTGSKDNTARLWDAASGKELAVLRHESLVPSVAFGPDGTKVLTGSWDKTARLWDAASGKELALLSHRDLVLSVAFSPDGRKLATVRDSSEGARWDETIDKGELAVRLWDAASGKEVAMLHGEDAVFSADGRMVATVSRDNTARLWDAESGREIVVLNGHEDDVKSVAFSPDGRMVATGSHDKTARLWDAASGRELAVLPRGSFVTYVAFGHDGRTLATDDWLWPVGQSLIDRACARVHELPLSDEDRKQMGISDEWCIPEVSAALRTKLGMYVQ